MKKILGLDLGTNSIGWAHVKSDFNKKEGEIVGLGSRIIPMTQDVLGKFDSGVSISQTAERTGYRGTRRLYQRDNLRRERLHRVLNVLGFLPDHYQKEIDFEKKLGQFKNEVKINIFKNEKGENVFLFRDSFLEMTSEFRTAQSQLFYQKEDGEKTRIPYDWTLYYLRKKALTKKISKEELAWIILNFNQKRGYFQLRGDELDSKEEKNERFYALKVKSVAKSDVDNAKDEWYEVTLENDWIYKRKSKEPLDSWIGKIKEFIVTTSKDKNGKVKRSFRAPKEDDWGLVKKKTEQEINASGVHVCEYIYSRLLMDPKQKIRGKLIKTIERKYYRKELEAILEKQIEFHPELQDRNLYSKCINELYQRNEGHKSNIKDRGFDYLFIEDIIFYQRPLKSKKSTISGCPYESRRFKKAVINEETGLVENHYVSQPIKVISRSNPLFQEFRLWQFLRNLKIYKKEDETGTVIDADITMDWLSTEEEWVNLFDFISNRKEIDEKSVIGYFVGIKVIPKKEKNNYRWNYVQDKKYPGCETRAQILTRLSKVEGVSNSIELLTHKMEMEIWHLIYSVKDVEAYLSGLKRFAKRYDLEIDSFVSNFAKFPPFKNEYGAYSEKAIKKLLTVMRRGKYFDEKKVAIEVKDRVTNVMERVNSLDLSNENIAERINDISDDDIPKQLIKSFIPFQGKNPMTALNTYQACYAIYDRHSEIGDVLYWKSPDDIDAYLSKFKQHSLRNPIVEQVVTETLRTVRDIWRYYGNGEENYFDEIHIELGREMKNPADKRKAMSARNIENENTNERIKALLKEMMNEVKEVKPYSPSQQEKLKIYEDGVRNNPAVSYDIVKEDEIEKIRKVSSPTTSEIKRYKLWLEQGYLSPYTGKLIPLSSLFTTDYQIEHVIPQSRYFDNSMSNKVICESAVNGLKDNQTAYEFIKNHGGQLVDLGLGNSVEVYSLDRYESHCNKYFKKNRSKLRNLLSEDIPEGFINRQLNDSRYISKLIKGLLSNIVREEGEREAIAQRVVPVTGSITSKLKRDWGLNDKWNELISPRFKRLNELTESSDFGYWDKKINAFRITVPDQISKGFSKKRIDHRHHALDALVIACCTKDHINYITSLNTNRKNFALVSKLRKTKEIEKVNKNTGEIIKRTVAKEYHLPWASFPVDGLRALETTVVSFKQNLRVINKTNNKTWQWVEKDGKLKKDLVKQEKGDSWAIRKSMHKETVSGLVLIDENKDVALSKALENFNLIKDGRIKRAIEDLDISEVKDRIAYFKKNPLTIDGEKVKRVKVYTKATAVRTSLSELKTMKHIEKITDSGIKKILLHHLDNYKKENGGFDFEKAFNSEGVIDMNKNIDSLNNGKKHQPIFKVRLYEAGNKFAIGQEGSKSKKYVEAAKGTNLFFAIYEKDGKRNYETIPLNEVIEHQKWRATIKDKEERNQTPMIPINSEKGDFLFSLSPNDLVYVPTDEEIENPGMVDFGKLNKEQVGRIYKFTDCSMNTSLFMPYSISEVIFKLVYKDQKKAKIDYPIQNEVGLGSRPSKSPNSINGLLIKERCWKLNVDRIGVVL